MVALGIVKFITTPNIPILAGIWTVYWMYQLTLGYSIFGVLLILHTIGLKLVKEYFGFLASYCGKGMFIILYTQTLIQLRNPPHRRLQQQEHSV